MLIGILQSGHFAQREGAPLRDYSTLYAEMLAGHGFRFKTWSVVDMEFPASPEDADGWLISGSKHRKISRRLVGRKRGLRLSRRQQSLLERVASGSSRDTSS